VRVKVEFDTTSGLLKAITCNYENKAALVFHSGVMWLLPRIVFVPPSQTQPSFIGHLSCQSFTSRLP